jgi:hypothetical protein
LEELEDTNPVYKSVTTRDIRLQSHLFKKYKPLPMDLELGMSDAYTTILQDTNPVPMYLLIYL